MRLSLLKLVPFAQRAVDRALMQTTANAREYYPKDRIRPISVLKVRILLALGANPNVCSNYLSSGTYKKGLPLLYAAIYDLPSIAKMLLRHGAFVEVEEDGETPLRLACKKPEILEALLDAGADIDAVNYRKETALMKASYAILDQNDQTPVRAVQVLLDHGANVNLRDLHGQTPLMRMFGGGTKGPAYQVASLLVAKSDLEIKDDYGQTALMLAAQWGSYWMVEEMIAKGVKLDSKDRDGKTAYYYAQNTNSDDPGVKAKLLKLLLPR
ncbi:MAG TPA: ankyrin repeat domain-containing protein [Ignavibacteriaceae bacterium]|nr:ankyrin repeat domain-containing protein [Ignavibacteriaceae bacterium]